jgi:hypothetical protein
MSLDYSNVNNWETMFSRCGLLHVVRFLKTDSVPKKDWETILNSVTADTRI